MKGLNLRSLSGELRKVPAHQATFPVQTIKDLWGKLGLTEGVVKENFGENAKLTDILHYPTLEAYKNCSFEEICKIYYSSRFIMQESVNELFEKSPPHEVFRKIKSSMWRWGCSRGTWNEIVEAYEHIRHFSLGLQDFEVRLDHTTSYNEFGWSKYGRIYLDGVFAYLFYYKGKHVMTIGFSVQSKKRLLIQQVQSTSRGGNRWLYKLPSNRLEFVIGLFLKNFPDYQLWVVDGGSSADRILENYRESLQRVKKFEKIEEAVALEEKIKHLGADKPRLAAFYSNTGQFVLGNPEAIQGIIHRPVILAA